MLHDIHEGAAAPGHHLPVKGTTPADGPALQGTQGTGEKHDSGSARRNGQPFRYAQGEAECFEYLVRLRMRQTRRDELALILASAHGPKLRGICARLEAALLDPADDSKTVATMTARAALGGVQLHRFATGGFLLTRWNLSTELPDLASVAALLDRMGMVAP